MDRITVTELRKLIDDGQEIVILDVRPKEIRAQEGTIPGAVSAHPVDTDPAVSWLRELSRPRGADRRESRNPRAPYGNPAAG
jgi:hypothetical protein